jgi:alanine racemase
LDYKRVWAEINLDNLAGNYNAIRSRMPGGVKLMAVVKADAYGHGAVDVAKTLLYCGADALGVATCEEGVQLRENHISAPILVFGYTPPALLDEVIRHKLTQTVFSTESARQLSETAARFNTRADVHIKIDTGMGRLGFLPTDESAAAIAEITAGKALNVTGVYTHCATSDAPDNGFIHEQLKRFRYVLAKLTGRGVSLPVTHMANSGALAQIITGGLSGDFLFDMARTGILLYGLLPSGEMGRICAGLGLKPVMKLATQVGMVKTLPPGSGISYGHMFTTTRETKIATLPVGYADGYPRRLSNKARVLIGGQPAPVLGAVCMDQCMVDVTGIDAKPGDEAVLMGSMYEAAVSADELAGIAGTIGYELTCGVGKRVPRVYIRNNLPVKTLRMV